MSRPVLILTGIALVLGMGCSSGDGSPRAPKIAALVIDDSAAGGGLDDHGYAVALDANLRIVVAGASMNAFADYDMALWRFQPDGIPDATFGTFGLVIDDGAAGGMLDDFGYGVALDASGRINVTGASLNGFGDYDMVTWRYDSAGFLDLTFGTGGIVVDDGAAGGALDDSGSRLLVDSAWRILVTGFSLNAAGDYDMVVWAYDTNGVLDASFGNAGIFVYDGNTGGVPDDYGYDIDFDPGLNRYYVVGSRMSPFGDFDMAIWRITASGLLDPTFGTAGLVTHHDAAGGLWDDEGFGITLDAFGDILTCGYSYTPFGDVDMVVWKYTPAGVPEPSFGPPWGHVVRDNSKGWNDQAIDIATDFWGRVHAVGLIQPQGADYNMASWRFSPAGAFQKCAKGKNIAGGIGDDVGYAVVYDDINLETIVVGESLNGFGDYDMVIGLRRK